MLDVLRIVSSVDVGHDEFSAQTLVKKHKDVAEEIDSYRPVIDALHEQSRLLPPEKANSEDVSPDRRIKHSFFLDLKLIVTNTDEPKDPEPTSRH